MNKMKVITSVCLMLMALVIASNCVAANQYCQEQKTGYYRFSEKLSLKENFAKMIKQAKWQLVWRYPADLPVLANSSFKGVLFCSGGVLEQAIKQVKETETFGAMRIAFDTKNRVVLITDNPRSLNRSSNPSINRSIN